MLTLTLTPTTAATPALPAGGAMVCVFCLGESGRE
jgi:hypothetical protein